MREIPHSFVNHPIPGRGDCSACGCNLQHSIHICERAEQARHPTCNYIHGDGVGCSDPAVPRRDREGRCERHSRPEYRLPPGEYRASRTPTHFVIHDEVVMMDDEEAERIWVGIDPALAPSLREANIPFREVVMGDYLEMPVVYPAEEGTALDDLTGAFRAAHDRALDRALFFGGGGSGGSGNESTEVPDPVTIITASTYEQAQTVARLVNLPRDEWLWANAAKPDRVRGYRHPRVIFARPLLNITEQAEDSPRFQIEEHLRSLNVKHEVVET